MGYKTVDDMLERLYGARSPDQEITPGLPGLRFDPDGNFIGQDFTGQPPQTVTITAWVCKRPGSYTASNGDREVRITRNDGLYWHIEGHHQMRWRALGSERDIDLAKDIGAIWLKGDKNWREFQASLSGYHLHDTELSTSEEMKREIALDNLSRSAKK